MIGCSRFATEIAPPLAPTVANSSRVIPDVPPGPAAAAALSPAYGLKAKERNVVETGAPAAAASAPAGSRSKLEALPGAEIGPAKRREPGPDESRATDSCRAGAERVIGASPGAVN